MWVNEAVHASALKTGPKEARAFGKELRLWAQADPDDAPPTTAPAEHGEDQEDRDDPKDRGRQRAIEDGRDAEDRIIGPEMVVVNDNEGVQSMASVMMEIEVGGQAVISVVGREDGVLSRREAQLTTPQRTYEMQIATRIL